MSKILDSDGFLQRSVRASVFMGLFASLFILVYAGPQLAWRYVLFTAWMLLNLALWRAGAREMLGKRRALILLPLGAAKLIWIVFLVFLCGWTGIGEKIGNLVIFLLGFNTPFLVMSLKALGSVLTEGSGKKGFGLRNS